MQSPPCQSTAPKCQPPSPSAKDGNDGLPRTCPWTLPWTSAMDGNGGEEVTLFLGADEDWSCWIKWINCKKKYRYKVTFWHSRGLKVISWRWRQPGWLQTRISRTRLGGLPGREERESVRLERVQEPQWLSQDLGRVGVWSLSPLV